MPDETAFRSTLPRGERRAEQQLLERFRKVSIHAPARGATLHTVEEVTEYDGFDPRSRAGSDAVPSRSFPDFLRFDPRSRAGSDLPTGAQILRTVVFRSTLPRGERPQHPCRPHCRHPRFDPRSRAGSDVMVKLCALACRGFDPRSRAGSDGVSRRLYAHTGEFRSTLPRGERRSTGSSGGSTARFRSTLPRGERPFIQRSMQHYGVVSIHAPARGATWQKVPCLSGWQFRSTLPRGERRPACRDIRPSRRFDPRSRAGSDFGGCAAL